MARQTAPVIDMTPDGAFIDRAKPKIGTIAKRLAVFGIALFVGGLLLRAAVVLLPVLLLLGVAGYFVVRAQLSQQRGMMFRRPY